MTASEAAKERVIMVEYLQPTMCKDLLCKFPDSSAFGFDYSQSGIWSPPIIRRVPFDGYEKISQDKLNKVKGKTVKKKKKKKKKRNRNKEIAAKSSVRPPGCFNPKQGWGKVLRAATRRLKKPEMTKRPTLLQNIPPAPGPALL